MTELNIEAYSWSMAKSLGLDPMWREDLQQEVRIAVWKYGCSKVVIRGAVVDTLRRLGPHTRRGYSRCSTYLSGEYLSSTFEDGVVQRLDALAALKTLQPKEASHLRKAVEGRPLGGDSGFSRLWRIRKKIRLLVA